MYAIYACMCLLLMRWWCPAKQMCLCVDWLCLDNERVDVLLLSWIVAQPSIDLSCLFLWACGCLCLGSATFLLQYYCSYPSLAPSPARYGACARFRRLIRGRFVVLHRILRTIVYTLYRCFFVVFYPVFCFPPLAFSKMFVSDFWIKISRFWFLITWKI